MSLKVCSAQGCVLLVQGPTFLPFRWVGPLWGFPRGGLTGNAFRVSGQGVDLRRDIFELNPKTSKSQSQHLIRKIQPLIPKP